MAVRDEVPTGQTQYGDHDDTLNHILSAWWQAEDLYCGNDQDQQDAGEESAHRRCGTAENQSTANYHRGNGLQQIGLADFEKRPAHISAQHHPGQRRGHWVKDDPELTSLE